MFDEELARKELTHMIIIHEYPLSRVEHVGFRRYSKALQPSFTMISRNTLRKDILKVFDFEKGKTVKLLGSVQSKVAITTYMWTAQSQKRGFIAITAHWIDSSWKLQNRILRFAYVSCPHTAENILEELLKCFSEWNINRKISSLTVDNCSCNDAIIGIHKDRLDLRALPLRDKFFHMHCCANILTIIVKDELEVIESSIDKAATRYPILDLIAGDIYAIPISTVASESVFSTGGRFISPHGNRLHPKTLEALLCGRDWLSTTIKSSSEDEDSAYCHGTFDEDYDAEVDEEFDG